MKNNITACTIAFVALALATLCCCPYFTFGESSNPKDDFETLVWSPMPPGVTPIAADYEFIGLGDGKRSIHFRVETPDIMDEIIERHHLTQSSDAGCIRANEYPLENWQTAPTAGEIECFQYIEYHEGESGAIDYTIVLYLNQEHTEGVFTITYF